MLKESDVLLDPYRPGSLERLGLNFDEFTENEAQQLIVARVSGYGQVPSNINDEEKSYYMRPGHDINYLAESGALWSIVDSGFPTPPDVLIADFAGGAYQAVIGILLALLQRSKTGKGSIIDASITSGTSYLFSFFSISRQMANRDILRSSTTGLPIPTDASLFWNDITKRGVNLLDGGAPFYRAYSTLDDQFIVVGALEPQFYQNLLQGLGISPESASQMDRKAWPRIKDLFASIFKTKTREQWLEHENGFLYKHACLSPVFSPEEALERRPQNQFRSYSKHGYKLPVPFPKIL
ncbi:hypothetical protein Ciccas_001137 [Cichlidogyrus casuarinus]|uniref:Alpha-methylacyl-CoA racemase n=1 Tax=Cichlidogyrus casuarinus TaxID=1844966 RepID=A0ABD2QKY6_9PLAT